MQFELFELLHPNSLKNDIDNIVFSTPFHVVVKIDKNTNPALYVRSEEKINTIDFELSIDIYTKTLYVKYFNKNLSKINPNETCIYFNIQSLQNISNVGSGFILGSVYSEEFSIDNKGSGIINLNIKNKKTAINNQGSGDIILSGNTNEIEIDSRGSGNINIINLPTKNVNIKSCGSGNIYTFCTNKLTGKIRGSSNVYFSGNPKEHVYSYGTGQFLALEEKKLFELQSNNNAIFNTNNKKTFDNLNTIKQKTIEEEDYDYDYDYDFYDEEDDEDEEYNLFEFEDTILKKTKIIDDNIKKEEPKIEPILTIKQKLSAKIKKML